MTVRNDFQPGEFCWVDLASHDLTAAAEWYGGLFDWTHQVMPTPGEAPPYAFFMRGEAVVAGIGQMNDEMKAQGIPPMWNSYVCTDDCEKTEARVRELGGTVTVPTQEVMGYGKLAFFLDPEGASFAAWQTLSPDGQGVLMKEAGGLSWVELMTRDKSKVSEFYGKLFGWEFSPMPMDGVDYEIIKNRGEDTGGVMPMDGPQFEGVPAHWLVYFDVADCDGVAARAKETGGEVLVPPTEIPVGKFAVLRDPQGGAFSVITLTGTGC